MLEGFEREVRCPPGEGSNNITVNPEDIKRCALVSAREIGLEDLAGVVVGSLASEHSASRFEQLEKRMISNSS